jgi:hypothetical protein
MATLQALAMHPAPPLLSQGAVPLYVSRCQRKLVQGGLHTHGHGTAPVAPP